MQARELYYALGTPSIKDFKAILCMNFISHNPVTIKDIKIAQQIFGLDIRSLKSKITGKKPLPVVNDYIVHYKQALKGIITIYNKARFRITKI
jgi:hypothetical protein